MQHHLQNTLYHVYIYIDMIYVYTSKYSSLIHATNSFRPCKATIRKTLREVELELRFGLAVQVCSFEGGV